MKYRFHHIGIATDDIDYTAGLLSFMGYKPEETQYDPLQNVNVKFCGHAENPLIELLGEADGNSPLKNLLKKNGTCPYHVCYEVDNIDKAILKMRENGYLPTGPKRRSVIGGRNVVFLYHPHNFLIELLDGGKDE